MKRIGSRPIVAERVVRALVICLLGLAVHGFGEAMQNGQYFMWRNELQTDVNLRELVTAWVPYADKPVKGFFFLGSHGGCPGADNRPWAMNDSVWHNMAKEYGFGCMATSKMCGYEYEMKNTNLLYTAIQEMADAGDHPEIANVPLIVWGGSNSASTGYSLVNLMPEKILCGWLNCPAAFNPGTPTDGGIQVPAVWSTGENDWNRNNLPPVVANARGRGARWAYVEVQGMGHEDWRVYHVARP
ncbi:MAG: hypothetical protein GF331_19135, partial [Chitinivibrionales bacterium]|nr:hypothetical protein [Chitinivibrionales bacterium]